LLNYVLYLDREIEQNYYYYVYAQLVHPSWDSSSHSAFTRIG